MSFKISPKFSSNNNKLDSTSDDIDGAAQDEWVEIIEPKSKTKIYANLLSGICAKNPPDGVPVLTTSDFSDYWWELYDKKTDKYYYYNPEQQKTVWTRPTSSNNGDSRRLLIIPVSKLRTFRKMNSEERPSVKCDASTQTIASSLISTGTQTISETDLEVELSDKLRIVSIPGQSTKHSSCTHTGPSSTANNDRSPRSQMGFRQHSDFAGRPRNPYLKNYQRQVTIANESPYRRATDQADHQIASQYSRHMFSSVDGDHHPKQELDNNSAVNSYFTPPLSTYQKNRNSLNIQEPISSFVGSSRRDELKSSTSTFKNIPPKITTRPVQLITKTTRHSPNPSSVDNGSDVQGESNTQHMVTNNLSHYLVREARAMGIALISDDEVEDDDQESDDECNLDDDEDTDLRDDLSNQHEVDSELHASQDLCEDSSEGWKSFSDQDSPNEAKNNPAKQQGASAPGPVKSPMPDEVPSTSSRTHNELIDDQLDPSTCMSQQLDHRKLVANFRKSRQTSALGFNDSLTRSYRLDANQAVQRIKTVADSYFHHNDRNRASERHLRQLSALTTLPRPNKDKLAINEQEFLDIGVDADYDVVEENFRYYSDSERLQAEQISLSGLDTSKNNTVSSSSSTSKTKPSTSPVSYFDRNKSTRGSTFSVESFARENLTRHPKGGLLFNRKVKWSRMISWTKNSIKQPMISSVSSDLNADSINCFKLIQQYMGDRKVSINKKYRQILAQAGIGEETYCGRKSLGRSNSLNVKGNTSGSGSGTSSSGPTQIPDRLRDELAYELSVKGCTKPALRDEIFVQLARQLTENPCMESVTWGLILMSILLSYFSPSSKFAPFLNAFLESHPHIMARDVCLPRLEKRLLNLISYCRKPSDGHEISIVRLSITKWPQYCGVFGESLEKIMSLQACSPYLKTLRLPWILTTLGKKLAATGGYKTEGLFRCAADHDLLAQLRLEIDCVDFRKITDAKQVKSLLSNVEDPHVVAGLLKLFFRQLHEPVFPMRIYDACLSNCQDGQMACRLFDEHLPNLNKDVVAYLIRLLQTLAESNVVTHTKMDTSNLSMVWAPNLLRAPQVEQASVGGGDSRTGSKWSIANGEDSQQAITANVSNASTATPSQSMIFEHARQEMQFIKALITHLDTSFITNVV